MPRKTSARTALQRLDRIAGDLNVLLMLFAIGLATLDVTCLVGQRLLGSLPDVLRVTYVGPSAGASSAVAAAEPVR